MKLGQIRTQFFSVPGDEVNHIREKGKDNAKVDAYV